jgi:hypothetical protein
LNVKKKENKKGKKNEQNWALPGFEPAVSSLGQKETLEPIEPRQLACMTVTKMRPGMVITVNHQ